MTASYTMAHSALLEPSGPPPSNDESPHDQYQETATILKRVVAEQNGSTNPTHRAVLILLELRADLEHRYFFVDVRHEPRAISRDIDDAMHLSADFLQNITDPCLDMAKRIRHLVDTFVDGAPEGIAKIKRLRTCQLTRLHHLQERWEDMLQTAREFDESVTFRRLSDIVESTEDTVDEAWLHAKEFIDSCEADVKHRPNDPFPATLNTPSPLQPTAATRRTEHLKSQSENPKPTVLHHTPTTNVSRVNTKEAVCATVAHHEVPHDETLPPVTSPRRYNQSTDNDTESLPYTQSTDVDTASLPSLPSLDPDQGGDIAATDPTDAPEPVTNCYLNELTATLGIQMRRVDKEKTDAKRQIADKTVLTELGTLMITSRDTIEKATQTSTVEPTDTNLSGPNTPRQTPNTPTWTWPLSFQPIGHNDARRSLLVSPISDLAIVPRSDRPTEKPTGGAYCIGTIRTEESDSQSMYHIDGANPMLTTNPTVLGEERATATRKAVGATSKKNVRQTDEDHNWRRHVPREYHTKEAVFAKNRPNLKPGKTRKADVNKHTIARSVGSQASERTDVHPVTDKMNRFIADDLRSLHQSTWTRIRDKEPLPCQTNTTPERSESKPVIAKEIIRKITTAYEVADWAPKVPLPRRANGAHAPMEAIEENHTLHANRAEARATCTMAEWTRAQARHPSTKAAPSRSTSHTPKDLAIKSPQTRNHKTTSQCLQQDPSQDRIATEPVLLGSAPNAQVNTLFHPYFTRDAHAEDHNGADGDRHSQNLYYARGLLDDNSIVFLDSSDSANESGVGDCATSTTASYASSRASGCRGRTRLVSYILTNGNPTDIPGSSWTNGRHDCRTCKNGARCGCPHDGHAIRIPPPDNLGQPQQRRNKAEVDHIPETEADTTTSSGSDASVVVTFHCGASNSNLYGHRRATKEKSAEIIQKWMKTYTGRPTPTPSSPK